MYRLMIIADEGDNRTMLTIGGEQSSIEKDMLSFIGDQRNFKWLHGSNELLAEALFIGLMKKYEEERKAEQ